MLYFFFLFLWLFSLVAPEVEDDPRKSSKRTQQKKQKIYAGGLTAEEVLEQVDDPQLQVLILSEGEIKSPILEYIAPTKKEYARRCNYCNSRLSSWEKGPECDDCLFEWNDDS